MKEIYCAVFDKYVFEDQSCFISPWCKHCTESFKNKEEAEKERDDKK